MAVLLASSIPRITAYGSITELSNLLQSIPGLLVSVTMYIITVSSL
jgi:hypothetical protein